ncbi:GYD domain-containing protein [bacterium]|nr:GYD domain-containing protein [bacterium]
MATYISLLKFTEKGSKAIKQTVARATQFQKAAARAGVKIVGQYWTMGIYDGVLVLQADHENDALRCLADLAANGYVTTHTLPAFEAGEIKDVLKG